MTYWLRWIVSCSIGQPTTSTGQRYLILRTAK